MKIFKSGIFFVLMCAFVAVFATNVFAVEIFFEHREAQELTRGVVYERNRMMTSRGMLDVHVIFVDVNEPYVTLAPVPSAREVGLRETTSRLLNEAGAVAGINADFFNMARRHSTYFGPMVRGGEVLSLTRGSAEFATFFLDSNNNPFFRYMSTSMRLYANGEFLTNIASYNSVGSAIHSPIIVSRAAMADTSAIDTRVHYTLKVIVENNIVTRTTFSSVETPENGFVIVIPHASLPYYERFLTVGTQVRFHVQTDINADFSNINAAIGGGSLILQNGELIEGAGVQPNARHPRSAVGALRDGRVILVAVDGRSHSIGVTHAELGAILRHYGAVNAMHMDGGGSTTLVTQGSVANTLSEGSQRAVTNALGVFNAAPVGEIVGIVLETEKPRAIQGVPMRAGVFGVDEWGNRIELYEEHAVFSASSENGFWDENIFTPLRTGRHQLRVRYGEFNAYTHVEVFSLGELQPQHGKIGLLVGGRTRIRFSGVATDGSHLANLAAVTSLRVFPENLGTFEDGYFVAQNGGVGYIEAAIGSIVAYIPVSVGGFPWPLDMFGGTHLGFLSTPPEYVSTNVSVENERIILNYSFGRTAATQATYATFYPALQIPGEPVALRMRFYGDESGHWLRARVRDADGTHHNITFVRNVDFTGWQTVTASLPNAPAPFTLDRIYLAELESFEQTRHLVMFYGLEALYTPNHNIPVPRGTVFQDRLRAASPPAGATLHEFSIPAENSFEVSAVSAFTVARLSTLNGGIQNTNNAQWQYLMPKIRGLNSPYVVILLDADNFTRRMERELFHLAMTQLRDEGRLVFVVSPGEETALTMRDNIRYISVPDATIRFWTEGEQVWWSD